MTKLIGFFRDCAKTPKNRCLRYFLRYVGIVKNAREVRLRNKYRGSYMISELNTSTCETVTSQRMF